MGGVRGGLMGRKAILFSLLLGTHARLAAVDVLLSEIAVVPATAVSSAAAAEMNSRSAVSRLLNAEIRRRSSEALSYRSIFDVEAGAYSGPELVSNDLQALAACVFYRVPYVMYGSILVDSTAATYTALLKVYSRDSHAVVLEVRQSAAAPAVDVFVRQLAGIFHQQLTLELLSGDRGAPAAQLAPVAPLAPLAPVQPAPVAPLAPAPAAPPAAAALQPAPVAPPAGPAPAAQPAPLPPQPAAPPPQPAAAPLPAAPAAVPSAAGPAARPRRSPVELLAYVAGGYFFAVKEEWSGVVTPWVMIEGGVKTGLTLARGDAVDFRIRPGLLVNYAFSINEPTEAIAHYHSLTPRLPLELCLGIRDRLNFWLGGGPEYRVDIIDYQTLAENFVTDVSFALGIYGSAGFEIFLGKQRSIAIGISDNLDVAFFSQRRIRNGILFSVTVRPSS